MLRAALTSLLMLSCVAQARAADLMTLVRANRWIEADAMAASLPDPVARKLVTYFRLLAPHGGGSAEIAAFMAASPNWPQQAVLARRRDEAIAAEPDDAVVLPLCDQAQSPSALERCAQADLRQAHDDAATVAAREAWVRSMPTPNWDADFLRGWAPRLTDQDQWQRFDRAAWDDPIAAALQIPHLTPDDQRRAAVRLALRRDDPRAGTLLAALSPAERAEPAMMLEQARWLRRAGHDDQALALWLADGGAAEHVVAAIHLPAFWAERNILARHRLHDGDAPAAYALAAGAAQTAPEPVADAAFLAGWVALRRLSDPVRARAQFSILVRVSSSAITLARGHYWLARTAAAEGDAAAAAREYATAGVWPNTYYGALAILAGNPDPAVLTARIMSRRDPGWNEGQAAAFAGYELARASTYLVGWGDKHRAATFLIQAAESLPEPTDLALAAHLANSFGLPEAAVMLARLAGRSGIVLLDAGWPVAIEVPRKAGLDPALALGIARQESSFDPAIVSPAGARGLMQLMPRTAMQEARKLGLGMSVPALTADPAYNMALGADYLHGLLDRYGSAEPLAIAAYNAGPARIDEWLTANGDPRGSGIAMLDWIELIPFGETRNYVQRVIENTLVYRAKLGEVQPHPVLRWQASPA